MENNCQNCDRIITENFCCNCGQKKYKRIDRKYIWDEIQYTTLHANKGFLYSLKNILKNPGKTARTFVEGNRVNHYKPILMVFVLSGFSSIISFKVLGTANIMKKGFSREMSSEFMTDYSSLVPNNYSFIMLLAIPFLASFSALAFYKLKHNYYEHIVMNAIGISYYTAIYIIVICPIVFITKENPTLCLKIVNYSSLIIPIMMVWFYKGFYPEITLKSIILRVLVIALMTIFIFMAVMIVFMIIYIVINGQEGMKYFQPQ